MRRLAAIALAALVALAGPAAAQDDEGTRLERLIEGALSGAGRDVTVRGFSGVLAGRSRMASLTIADAEGVWLSIEDAVLDWRRAALLRGRLQVAELSAARIEIARRPVADPGPALAPEASGTGFALPDLPVALNVGRLAATELRLGPTVLGQPVAASLDGALRLEGGEGEANLSLVRTDGTRGEIRLVGAFSNTTRVLALDLLFDEAPGGLAASLLGLPGAPAVTLEVTGQGPADDFAADIALATDGTERLGGTVETAMDGEARRFSAALSGDLRPLFEARFHPFFGARSALDAVALRGTDGATTLDRLTLRTEALDLTGRAVIGADGLPDLLDFEGALADPGGGSLLLPVGGPETRIGRATFELGFDASVGDAWRADIAVAGLDREGFSAERIALVGDGTIRAEPSSVTAAVDFRAEALDLGSAEARSAVGETVTGRAELAWQSGRPLEIGALTVSGETYAVEARGTVANAATTLDLDGSVSLRVEALEAFAGLAGRPLGGAVSATVSGRAGIVSGLVDLRGTATGQDLAFGEPRLDPYLAGPTALALDLRRTTEGVFLDTLEVAGPEADISASGRLRTGAGALSLAARLGDVAPLFEGAAGPGEARLDAEMREGIWGWRLDADALASTVFAEGTVAGLPDAPRITATGRAEVRDLSAYETLAGRPLGGSARADFAARADLGTARYGWHLEGDLVDGSVGIEVVDRFLVGETTLTSSGALADGRVTLDRLAAVSPRGRLEASGAAGPDLEGLALEAEAEIADLATLVPEVSGPASVTASLEPEGPDGPWDVSIAATAPGAEAVAMGTLRDLMATPEAEGRLSLSVADLSVVAPFTGRPLGGAVELAAEGRVRADLSSFDLLVDGTAREARTGIAALDRILAGTARLRLDGERAGANTVIRAAEIDTPLLVATAAGTIGETTAFDFSGRLADIAPFVPGFSGPVTAEGNARDAGRGRVGIEATIGAPAGGRASLSGTAAPTGETVSLALSGRVPLGLVNGVIAPRALAGDAQFDLRLDGPPALSSLSGRVTTSGASLTAPVLDLALDGLSGTVDLANSRAAVALGASVRGGGRVRLDGPVGLSGGFPAEFAIALDGVRLTDPALYQTVIDARLRVDGPLAGGAAISGRVDVGETEIRIPSTTGGRSGGLPEITHVGEPRGVYETRVRAGLVGDGDGRGSAPARYLLDVLVNAPNRLFVRGRGLDAELGGQLRIGGTTGEIAPAGRFDLIRGRLDILGRRLSMTEGSITLTGALDPQLRLVAETRAEEVDVGVVVEGPASDPAIRFESRPELPEDEVLALLLFGRGIETLSPLQIARLASAVATLGSSGGGLLGGLREGVGLADLDITSGEDGGAAVRAGAYIADNIYTDVTVDTTGEAEINLNLDLSPSVTVRGRTSNTGESGVGVFFERDY